MTSLEYHYLKVFHERKEFDFGNEDLTDTVKDLVKQHLALKMRETVTKNA